MNWSQLIRPNTDQICEPPPRSDSGLLNLPQWYGTVCIFILDIKQKRATSARRRTSKRDVIDANILHKSNQNWWLSFLFHTSDIFLINYRLEIFFQSWLYMQLNFRKVSGRLRNFKAKNFVPTKSGAPLSSPVRSVGAKQAVSPTRNTMLKFETRAWYMSYHRRMTICAPPVISPLDPA